MSAGRKQVKITADLVARTLHHLDELGRPYVVIFADIPQMFSNVSQLHAAAIIERQYMLNNKPAEEEIAAQAERLADIGQWGKTGGDDDSAKPA